MSPKSDKTTLSRSGRLQCACNFMRLRPLCIETNVWYEVVGPVFSSSCSTSFSVKLALHESKKWQNDYFSFRTATLRVQQLLLGTLCIETNVWYGVVRPVFSSSCSTSFSVKLSLQMTKKWLNDYFSFRTSTMRVQLCAIATAVYRDKWLVWGCKASI
jgi:hypothetical protein